LYVFSKSETNLPKGTFGTDELVKRIEAVKLDEIVMTKMRNFFIIF